MHIDMRVQHAHTRRTPTSPLPSRRCSACFPPSRYTLSSSGRDGTSLVATWAPRVSNCRCGLRSEHALPRRRQSRHVRPSRISMRCARAHHAHVHIRMPKHRACPCGIDDDVLSSASGDPPIRELFSEMAALVCPSQSPRLTAAHVLGPRPTLSWHRLSARLPLHCHTCSLRPSRHRATSSKVGCVMLRTTVCG